MACRWWGKGICSGIVLAYPPPETGPASHPTPVYQVDASVPSRNQHGRSPLPSSKINICPWARPPWSASFATFTYQFFRVYDQSIAVRMLLPRYGHDYLTKSRLDGVGIAYILVCLIWTVLLFTGLAVFLQHRGVDFIRMRNPLLVSTSILLIHVYLCLVFLLYPLNASYGCNAGFWVMSLYFPLGIALWHTANIQLLNLSSVQEELMSGITCHSPRRGTSPKFSFAGLQSWLRRTSVVTKTSIAVAVCFGLQVCLRDVIDHGCC